MLREKEYKMIKNLKQMSIELRQTTDNMQGLDKIIGTVQIWLQYFNEKNIVHRKKNRTAVAKLS